METDSAAPRSRRALLAAAAGTAAALAASAAIPLSATAADPDDVVAGVDNATTTTTSLTDSAADSTALAGNATGSGFGYGVLGTSAGAGGVVGWSVEAPDSTWFDPETTQYTGVFGYAPVYPDESFFAVGVWGDSPDVGVYGSGGWGVWGDGGIGVLGNAYDSPGTKASAPRHPRTRLWHCGSSARPAQSIRSRLDVEGNEPEDGHVVGDDVDQQGLRRPGRPTSPAAGSAQSTRLRVRSRSI